jgi:hypothetical protein
LLVDRWMALGWLVDRWMALGLLVG